MASKAVFVCAFAFLIQSIAGKSCYRPKPCSAAPSCGVVASAPTYSSGSGSVSIDVPDNGGPLAITSIGPITPTGIAIATDLGLNGDVVVSGVLPYLSAVAFEGQFATDGAAPVSYGCGDCVAITEVIGGNSGASGIPYKGCGCAY